MPGLLYAILFGLSLVTTPSDASRARPTTFPADSAGARAAGASLTIEPRELVVIDERVSDYRVLVDDLSRRGAPSGAVDIVLLDASRDGLEQITEALASRRNLSAVHIVSHGNTGVIQLGSTVLDLASEPLYEERLRHWRDALAPGADLLFYGCDIASAVAGQRLLSMLGTITGADVAGSTNPTGHAALGGDWTLEYRTGPVNAVAPFSASLQQDWPETLAIAFDAANSAATSGAQSSLTFSHTVGSGTNRILVVEVSMGDSPSTVSSITYGGTGLTYLTAISQSGGRNRVEMWYLTAPAVGTANVVVTLAASTPFVAGATSFLGISQSTPFGTAVTAEGTGGSSSVTASSASGELVLDVVAFRDRDSGSANASQTTRWTSTNGTGSSDAWGGSSTKAGASSVTMAWTSSGAGGGEWSAAAVPLKPAPITTLGNGTDPSNASLAPGGSATMAGAFTFQTSSGTESITAATVTLAAGTSGGLSLVEITNDAGSTVYGSVSNPASDTPSITLSTNITATTTSTQYKIRVTPKSHTNMPAPAGSTYSVTARVSAWTGTNEQAGSDTAGTTVTIDNLSPGNVTSSAATAGASQVSLSWTNPADADLGSIIVLRRTTSAVTDTPVEGTTYTVGNTIGSSTVACVVTAPTASCTDTGLTNGTAYYYKVFAKDTSGNYATGATPTGSPATPNATTLATGTDPSNASLAPGGAATMADAFTFQTGTGTDTITAITVTIATGTSGGVSLVEITNDAGSTVYGSASNPASDTPAITLSTNITATTTSTQYKIRVTPKSHANMPAPAGSTYSVTAYVSNWTGTLGHLGSDTGGTTVTIDNLSPGNATGSVAEPGNTSVDLTWTNPGDADLGSIIVLRRTTSAVTDTPTEGATYVVGNTIGSSTVACVVAAPGTSCTATGLTNGTAYYFKIFTKDTNGNYSTGATPTGSPVTPDTQTLSSAANQTFAVGDASTTASALTVTDFAGKFKPGSDIYFVIPGTLSMIWDNTVGAVSVTGGAAAKVSATPTYTSSSCVMLTVISNFNPSDQVTVSGLKVKSFTGAGGPDYLTLGLKTCGATVATDDKTKTITLPPTTLGDGTDPSNASLAPGGAATMADAFTLQTGSGTDTITAITVTLAAGTSAGLSLVEITNSAGSTVYGSVTNPASDTPAITLTTNITATTSATTYKIRGTPKSHANMPAPVGSTYSVTAYVSNWTGTNPHAGSDTGGTIVTVDNLSPGNVTSSTATAGNTQVSLSWTNPGDSDLGTIIVLRRTTSAVTDTPTEGATYSVGNTIGSSTVACVVTAPTASCTDTGLTNGTAYYYKIFAKDTNGNYATGATPTGSPATPNVTTLGDGTDPGNTSLAPGGAATMADAFTFQTASATDTITAVTVTLAAGTSAGLSLVEITDSAGATVYGSVTNPGSDTPAMTLTTNVTATTTATTYKIRVTPKSHANMPPPAGSNYSVTARISAWTGTNAQTGSDTAGATVTIDNLSPGNVTSGSVSAGSTQAFLSWTNPGDSDLGTIIVLRRASSAVTDTPTEGATYSVGDTIGSSTVACVVTAPTASCTDTGLTNGTAYYYKIFAKDTNGNYATGATPSGSPVTPSAGFTVTPTSGLTTTEAGGTATFTIVLTSQPAASVTIGLSSADTTEGTVSPSSVTFTTANWNSAQTVTVTGVDDNLDDGDIAYTITTAAATSADSGYNGLNPSDVSVTTTDNDTSGFTVSPTSGLTTTEAGGTATFTIVLTAQPTANVTVGLSTANAAEGTVSPSSVTFTTANWNSAQTVTVTGVDDSLDDGSVAYTIVTAAATSSDANYNGLNPSDVSVTNTDNDTSGFTVSAISGNTTEAGGTATFTVVLTAQPAANVTVGLSSNDTTEGTVSPSSVTFTSANWNTPQTVTATGVDDSLDDGDIAYSIVTAAASSSDGNYNGVNPSDVSVTNADNDTSGFTVSAIGGNTTEAGGTASFTIVLTTQPTANVTVGLSSNDTTEGTVSPSSVTFTSANWSTPQTATVTGVDDALNDGDITFSIVTAAATSSDTNYNGLDPGDVMVINADDDSSGFTVSPTSGLTTTEAGGTSTFTVVLTAQPTANVTLGLSSSDTTEGTVSPSSLTFTNVNWNTAQTVTVTGVDDSLDDGNIAYQIVTAAAVSADSNFNGVNPSDVSVTNTDDDTSGFTVSAISGNTTEAGATATFTIVLTAQPTANVIIGLSSNDTTEGTVSPSSVTFTNADWNTPQTVTVTGVDDSLDDGDIAYQIVTAAATSSDTNYSGLNAGDVPATNADDDGSGITVSPTSGLTTTEAGGTATFTVVLTAQPTADVTIGLSSSDTTEGTVSPSSVTFTSATWNTPQTVTVTGVDDSVDDGDIAYGIVTAAATSADSAYNGLNPSDVSVTTADDDTAGFTVSAISGNTTEAGGTATFTIVLHTQPTANVAVALSSSDTTEGTVSPSSVTFTSADWNTPQTVTATGVDDALNDGDITFSIVTAAASSADTTYSGLNPADVSAINIDNDSAGFTLAAISGNTTEAGASATFTIVLTSQPTADVTVGLSSSDTTEGTVSPASVTFTSANWNTAQTVTVTGVDDSLDDGNITYTIVTAAATSADSIYNGLNPSDVSATNVDDDSAGITVSSISGNTTEAGGIATFTIVLAAQPTANVSIGLSSSNTTEGTVSPSSVTFTSANWSTPQTVTVTGVDDNLDDGNVTYTIVTAPATSSDPEFSGLDAADASVINVDNDSSGFTVTPTSGLSTTEAGGTATFTIALNAQPTANVTLGISSSNTNEATVSPSAVTFTPLNWNTAQTITATGVDDSVDDGDVAYSIVTGAATSGDVNYDALNPTDVSATNVDNDSAGIVLSPTSGLTTTEAGGTATFTIVLATQPTANVTIGVSSSDTTEGTISPASVTFTSTNWNTPQTVTVAGVDDSLDDGNIGYTLVTAAATSADGTYSGVDASDASATNTDDDAAGVTITPGSGLVTTEGGGAATFTIVLDSQPTANVTVGLSSNDTTEGTVSPASVTFTSANWNTPQMVTVTGVDDALADGSIAYSIVTAAATSSDGDYNGLNPGDVSVTNSDNDAAGITVTPTSGLTTTEAGGSATFTVVLTAQPTADVTIGLSSNDTTEGTVGPSSVTFTSANWNAVQTVTVTGVDDAVDDNNQSFSIVTAAAASSDPTYSGMNAADVAVSNTDDDGAGIFVTPTSGLITTEAGGTATFTVVLASQPTADVLTTLTSNDTTEGTVSPASLTFTAANWNTAQTVTVTGVDDALADGDVAFTVTQATATSADPNYNGFPHTISVTNTDNDTAGITVTPTSGLTTTEAGGTAAFTVVMTSQPTADVTIGLSSSDTTEGTVSPASVTFTSANWNTPQTVTITGVDDALADGAIVYSIVTAAVTSADAGYNGVNASDVSVTNSDNDSAGITVTPTSGLTTTEAGGTAAFTIVPTSQPTADVTVGLSSSDTTEGTVSPASVTFTSANWSTPQTVTVTGVDDSLADGAIAYWIITAAATSADAGYNNVNPNDVSVTNTDNDTAGITVTPTSGLTTTEAGGTAASTIVLTSQPTADVSIGLSSNDTTEGTVNPSSVTFTSANWNTPQTVTITGVDDALADGAIVYSVVTAAATSADAGYNGLNPSDVAVTNSDNDATGITVTPTSGLTTTEAGGAATFTLVLTSQPTADVTIGLSSSDPSEGTVSPASVTFSSANWNSAQTITVTGVDDALADGVVVYNIVTAAATSADGGYNGLNASDVSVTNSDNDAAGITVSPTSGLTTTEAGGTAAFTIVLTSQPTADVTIGLSSSDTTEGTVGPSSVTFTSANWNSPQTVTVTGVDDALADGAIVYWIITAAATSADAGYNNVNPNDVSVTNTDNDTAGITVTPTSGLTTTEAGVTVTFTVVLTAQPTADVTIGLSSSDTTEGTVSPSSVTFTSANWNSPQTVTVTGVDDALADGAIAYSIITAAATSADAGYNNLNPSDVAVTNGDNDAAGITVTPTSGLTTTEAGGTATFTIVLTAQPTADVTIGLSSSDTTEGTVGPSSVTFTSANWNSPQTVTVTGVDDALADGAIAYSIVTAAATSADAGYTGVSPSDVAVTNGDNDAAGITVTPTSGLTTTEAGGTATFTVVLTAQPTADVTIGLSSSDTTEGTVSPSSVTFTSANWNSPQTVTATGVDDALADGAIAYSIVTAAATSADAGYNGLNASDVSVTNSDNDAAGITVTPTSGLTTTEAGGTATFTIVLTSQPTADVTIGLSSSDTTEGTVSPSSVTFTTVNWSTSQTVTVTGVDDALADGAIAYSIVTAAATSADAGYNGLNASDVSVTNSDNDAAGITVTPTSGLTTTEAGGTATFTIVLTSQPTADVTIGLSSSDTTEGTVSPSSATFTSANWNTPQTVTITGVDDALADGAITYSIVTAAATSADAGYNNVNPSDVAVTNTDNDAAGITLTPTSGLTTTEAGSTAAFTIVLTSQPTADVTMGLSSSDTTEGTVSPASVTFTTANWNAPQTVTVTGVDDALADGAIVYSIVTAAATSADAGYTGVNPSDVSVTNSDNDAAGITVAPTSGLTTTEAGGTATFTIVLTAQPTADVTIGLSSSDTTEGTVSPASVTFTSANWSSPQTVTVTGVDDALADGAIAYTIVTAAATSADGGYNGLNASDVSVTNTDNDTAGISVTPSSGLTTTEAGGTATFTIVLTSQPTADVTIGISSSDTTEGTVSPSAVIFTSANWSSPQTVTVTGVNDALADGAIAYTIVTAAATSADGGYNGLNASDVSVTNTDNDTAGITVTPTSGLTTTEAGGTATFTVVLTAQPTADVTIGLSSSDTTEGTVGPSSVTFTSVNWSTPQTVTITGVDDALADGAIAYSIVTAAATSADGGYTGLNPSDVSATNSDNDTAGISVTPTSGLTTTEAGGTATFTIVLTAQPTADVTIGLSSSDTTEGTVGPSSVTFTAANWNSPQTVTVTGVDDALADGAIAYSIVTAAATSADPTYNGANPSDVSVTNSDNDTAGITVTPTSGLTTTEAGGTAAFTIVLTAQPTADVTVGVSSSDTTEGTVSPASVTFTSANWSAPQTVTVTGVDDALTDGAITYSIVTAAATSADAVYNGANPSDVSVTNSDNDTAGITVTPTAGLTTTEAGGTATFTIVLTAQPTADVTVGVSSSDTTEGTVSPASVTFTSANWSAPQTVTVTGVDDALADGAITYSIITAAATSADAVYNGADPSDVSVTNSDNDTAGITVTPTAGLTTTEAGGTATFTIVLTAQPTADVTVGLSSSDTTEGTVSPASVTFTPVNWNTPQTVTVTGVSDTIADGPVAYTIVTAAATSSDAVYAGANPSDVSVTNVDSGNTQADLAVSATANVAQILPGQSLVYTIVVTNKGPDAAAGVTVTDIAPNGVTFGRWTCTASTGSSCPATGSGNVSTTVSLLPGGVVTFQISGTATASVPESVSNTASVQLPAGLTDPVPANNTATATTTVAQQQVGVTVRAGTPSVAGPSAFEIPYVIDVTNVGAIALTNLQVTDAVSAAFAEGSPAVSVVAPPVGTPPCTANGAFTGVGAEQTPLTNLLNTGISLGAGQSCTISVTMRVAYPSPASVPKAAVTNRVTARTFGADGTRLARAEATAAVKLVLPRVDVTKAVTGVTQVGDEAIFDVRYEFVLENTSETDAPNVQLTDDLAQTFAPGSPLITIQEGPTLGDGSAPLTLATGPSAFTGTTVTALLQGSDRMPPGSRRRILLTVRVRYTSGASVPVDTDLANTAVATTSVTRGETVITRDLSTDVTESHEAPRADDEPTPSVVHLTPRARLSIQKIAGTLAAEVGETVQYAIRLRNLGSPHLPAATVTDRLPLGFRYVDGSARLVQGSAGPVPLADPAGKPGPVLTFEVPPNTSGDETIISYRLRLGPGSDRGDGVNVAEATSGSSRSGTARAKVFVSGGVFTTDACVVGKIFIDRDGNRTQRGDEPGIPGVHLTFEDGTTLVSDSEGRYSLCGLTPTTHVLKVDRSSLPPGANLVPSSSRNAGDGQSLFIDVKFGEVRRADFIVASSDPGVTAEVERRRAGAAEWRPAFAPEIRPTIMTTVPAVQAQAQAQAQVITVGGSRSLAQVAAAPRDMSTSAANILAPTPGAAPAAFPPGVRSMLVVGLLEGGIALSKARGNTDLAVNAAAAFEQELSRLSGTFANRDARYGARGAVFVKGQIAGDVGLTFAYDSEKDGRTRMFRDIQPEAFYPIMGDGSTKIFDAQTSSPFYGRVEHGRSYAMFGDVRVGTTGDATRLGAYNRSLTGVQGQLVTGRISASAFASRTPLHQVMDEIGALGISGPYRISSPNGLLGSERVEVITRDRNQPAVVLSAVAMTRFTDYEFEPFSGRLLFRRAIPSVDDRLNPVSIRVMYEVDDTLDGSGSKSWVGGTDATLQVTRRVAVGGSWVEDATPGAMYRLRSANGMVKVSTRTVLTAETADTTGVAAGTSGFASAPVGPVGQQGRASRIELRHESSRLVARAFAATADAGFSNPMAGIAAGRREAFGRVSLSLRPSITLVAEGIRSEDRQTGGRRTGGLLVVETKISRALKFEFGVRRSAETAQAAQGTSAGVLPFDLSGNDGYGFGSTVDAIDPASGLPLNRSGLSPQLTAGDARPAGPSDETTIRAKVTVTPTARVNLYMEAEQDIHDSDKRMAAVGAQVQVTEQNRAYARHEFISSLDGPYGLSNVQRRFDTVFGFASTVRKEGDLFSEYRLRDVISGREAEAAIGLRNQWQLAEGVRASAGFERLQVIQGQVRQASAVSGGLDYMRSAWFKGTGRLEYRTDPSSDTWLATLGFAQRVSRSWSLLAKDFYQVILPSQGPSQQQHRASIGGAYRSPDSNQVNLLTRYEWRQDDTPMAPGLSPSRRRTQSLSTQMDYQPAPGWTLSGQHAAKWVDDRTDTGQAPYRIDLLSGRIGYDLLSRVDIGALGSLMWSPSGGRQQALGGEVGFLIHHNLWLSVGNNAVGFRDRDAESANYTARGPFTRLRLKFN